jgi:geranylgeranyl reductase family protein
MELSDLGRDRSEVLDYDLIIIGAGPAGCAAAISLRQSGLKVALLDSAVFPRDKICGDALSLDVMNQFDLMDSAISADFEHLFPKKKSAGVRFSSAKGSVVDIPFIYKGTQREGYVCERRVFDAFMLKHALSNADLTFYAGAPVQNIIKTKGGFEVTSGNTIYSAKMLLGADGAQSKVARLFSKNKLDHHHYSAGLRMYCENVQGMQSDGYIELHFVKKALPGYLWIFPLEGNRANVGIGVLSSVLKKKHIHLRELFIQELKQNPLFKDRFSNAVFLEDPKGFGLPLGSRKRSISGDGFLLLGDAAGLIDPFSGEGIANAIRSGRVAAIHVKEAFAEHRFDGAFLKNYDKEIYKRMYPEFFLSRRIQMMCKYPFLMELLFKKVNSNKEFRQFFIDALGNIDVKKRLLNIGFWWRLWRG